MPDQENRTVTRLTDLEVKEVSLVDHPANEEVFLLMKRLGSELDHLSKAEWSTAFINRLPDSSFLYIEPNGEKDEDGRTTPRTLRHFPIRTADGEIDLPHLRNALSRLPQSGLPDTVKDRLIREAQRLLAEAKGEDDIEKTLKDETRQHIPEEGDTMIRTDSPIVKAAEEAEEKNAEEKATPEETEKAADDAMKMAEAAVKYAEALASSVDGLAETDEYKALAAALSEMHKYHAEMDEAMGEEAAEEAKSEEEKSEETEKVDEKADEDGADEEAEATTDEEKSEETEKSEDGELAQIRTLLAELHSKLGTASPEAEQAVAKGINALTERLDRVTDRLSSLETTRGISRGEADTTIEKSSEKSSLFKGLV